MPRTISIANAIESHKIASSTPYVCLLEITIYNQDTGAPVATRRFARNPEDVNWRGQLYEKGAFDISIENEAGKVSQVSLTVQDQLQVLQALMEANGGGIGSSIVFTVVNLGDGNDEPEAEEIFEVLSASSANFVHQFSLGAENALTLTFPRRRQTKDFCQWRYKDARCTYSGPLPSCDLTLQGPNGCAAHSNTINFGAYPGINSNGYRYV